jgi:hypothetical protein
VFTLLSLILVTTLFDAALISAQPVLGSPPSKTIRGEVAAVEGEFHLGKNSLGEEILKVIDKSYIITIPAGKQLELKLTRETQVPTRANPGDRIEAKISASGQTLSVMVVEER